MNAMNVNKSTPKIKAVILDWAGTTVDYGSFAPTHVFIKLFESLGIAITLNDARSGMGLMKKDHLRTILARPGVAQSWLDTFGKLPTAVDIDHLFSNFIPMQHAVLKEFAAPIPGLIEAIRELREREIKIGTTTGYLRSMMDVLAPEAERFGYIPDCVVCSDEVPGGRPYPWMCYQNAIQLGVYPLQAMIKVGDTLPDISEGINAGMWSVGLSLSGSLLGLNQSEAEALSAQERAEAHQRIADQLYGAGAHLVIEGIWDLPSAVLEIESRLLNGEKP